MDQEAREKDKMEEMLVIPFIVIINGSIFVPLGIFIYQLYIWIRSDEWMGISLVNLANLIGMDLSGLYEPGWEGVKNIVTGFLEWPLSITSGLIIFFLGWFILFSICVMVEIIINFRSTDTYLNRYAASKMRDNSEQQNL